MAEPVELTTEEEDGRPAVAFSRLRYALGKHRGRIRCAQLWLKAGRHGPAIRQALTRHLLDKLPNGRSDGLHLDAAMDWIAQAQDVTGCGGVSSYYRLIEEWDLPYPETTGYIIGTCLAYANYSGRGAFVERAIRMGDWECEIQHRSGGVLSRVREPTLRVFNTGQVILGWCALYQHTGENRYLSAARAAGDYIQARQETDGSWVRDSHSGPRTYYARVAWALFRLAALTGETRFADAASSHLRWVLRQQTKSGWFGMCGFANELPLTHVIGYTLRGILESYQVATAAALDLGDLCLLGAVSRGLEGLEKAADRYAVGGIPGMLPSRFADGWTSDAGESCLTGNVQLSGVFRRFDQVSRTTRFSHVADMLLDATKRCQDTEADAPGMRGALPGSYPLYWGYDPFIMPNWATKFLADAILLRLSPPQVESPIQS